MRTLGRPFPDEETLTRGLRSVLDRRGLSRGRLTILSRKACAGATTFPSEIVTCRAGERATLWLLCKYASGEFHAGCGHPDGVLYEAKVYRQVLRPYQASTPTCYGTYTDRRSGTTWLILEYLKHCAPVEKASAFAAVRLAARWIGRFHAVHETRLARARIPFLTTYDSEYYAKWARRTAQLADRWHQRFPCLAHVCNRLGVALAPLAARPPTIIHGDFYASNILFNRGVICPVDWEDAAIAAGEIDLATLTEGWPGKIIKQLEAEYQRARWSEGPPADFERILALACVYVQLRWLGDERTKEKDRQWRFNHLHRVSQQLGLA